MFIHPFEFCSVCLLAGSHFMFMLSPTVQSTACFLPVEFLKLCYVWLGLVPCNPNLQVAVLCIMHAQHFQTRHIHSQHLFGLGRRLDCM